MRLCSVFSILCAVATIASLAARETAPDGPPAVAHLIAQLGSDNYRDREEANHALYHLGQPALAALRQAADNHPDAEVRRRTQELVRSIAQQLETTRLLTPQKVHMTWQAVPIAQVVADFKKKTGLAIELAGDQSRLAHQTVTLDTGETTSWQALELLCRKAGLREESDYATSAPEQPSGGARERKRLLLRQHRRQMNRRRVMEVNGEVLSSLPDDTIHLVPGKAVSVPTDQVGSIRIRSLSGGIIGAEEAPATGEIRLALETLHEPTLRLQSVIAVRVDQAMDDHGQQLSQALMLRSPEMVVAGAWNGAGFADAEDGMDWTDPRCLPIRLKAATRPSKMLTKLEGVITVEVQTPTQPLLTMANILNAAGQTVKNSDGSSLHVLDVRRDGDGQVKIRAELTNAGKGGTLAGGIIGGKGIIRVVGGVGATGSMPAGSCLELISESGEKFRLVKTEYQATLLMAGTVFQDFTATFTAPTGASKVARLVWSGPRTVIIEIPFSLKDVPLS